MSRVLFLLPSIAAGGAERVVSIISSQLVNQGCSVDIAVFNDSMCAYEISKAVQVKRVGRFGASNGKLAKIDRLFDLIRYMRKNKGAVIVPFHPVCLKYAITAARFADVQVIACERNDPYHLYETDNLAADIRKLYAAAAHCVFQTQEAREFYSNLPDSKCTIIPNPVTEPQHTWCGTVKAGRIISVCRLTAQKNLKMAIDAFAYVLKVVGRPISFDIFGQGECREELEKYAEAAGVAEWVHFRGVTKEVQKELAAASVFISSSDYEGISNSMLEAMAIGMPVVCTDCPIGGARETITENVDGLLVPVGDSKAMAEAIIRILQDEAYAQNLGRAAHEIVDRNSLEMIARRWRIVFEEMAQNG